MFKVYTENKISHYELEREKRMRVTSHYDSIPEHLLSNQEGVLNIEKRLFEKAVSPILQSR